MRRLPALVSVIAQRRLLKFLHRLVLECSYRLPSHGALVLVVFMANAFRLAQAEDWPQWRGPRRDAVSLESGLLSTWPDDGPPTAWRASSLGTGYASVVVSRDRVFTIGQYETALFATALQADDGKRVWIRKFGSTSRNSCSTPTVDDDRLYALNPDGEIVCLHCETGELIWERSLVDSFGGRMMSGRGYGESPLVDGEQLVCTPGGPDAAIVALDKRTGQVIWKSAIPDLGTAGRDGAGFSSIVVTEIAGVRQYVQLMGRGLVGIDAEDGRWLWGYNHIANETANIPTPVVRGDLVFAANGYGAGSVLLRISPQPGEDPHTSKWQAAIVYTLNGTQFQNHHGGVALLGDYLYGGHGSNNGLPTCLEFATGRVVWKHRGPGVGSAAVVAADGLLYFRYQNGLVALIEATDRGYHARGTLQVPGAGGDSWAHPVIANGRLLLREQDVLWAYDVRRGPIGETRPIAAVPPAPDLPAELVSLRKLGISVESLAEESRSIYRFAVDPSQLLENQSPFVVNVNNQQLTTAGKLSTESFERLRSLQRPLILNFAGTRVSEEGLEQLKLLKQIVGLNFELCSHLSDGALSRLRSLDQLRVLVLTGTNIRADGLRQLAAIKNLVALDLEVCDAIGDAACEALAEMQQLRVLIVKKTGFERERISDAGLEHLCRLPNLEVLNLYGNKLTDTGLTHLQRLKRLRELNLSLLSITDQGLVHLESLTNLQQLELLYSEGFAGPMLTDGAAETVQSLTDLTTLDLTGAKLTDSGLQQLRSLKKLKNLRLVRTQVTADGVRAFQLALPDCRIIVLPALRGEIGTSGENRPQ